MLGVGQRGPGEEILRAFRHVRNHFEQHDGFVEMIQVVGGEPGAGIDIGGAQLLRAGAVNAARRWWYWAIGSHFCGGRRGHPSHFYHAGLTLVKQGLILVR